MFADSFNNSVVSNSPSFRHFETALETYFKFINQIYCEHTPPMRHSLRNPDCYREEDYAGKNSHQVPAYNYIHIICFFTSQNKIK